MSRVLLSTVCVLVATVKMASAESVPYKPGDMVVAVKSTELQMGGHRVGKAEPGDALAIWEVKGDLLLVNSDRVGWVPAFSVLALDKSVRHFSDAIAKNSKDVTAITARARVFAINGKCDQAMADCNEALRLDPKSSRAYASRGVAWAGKGEYEKAIADLSSALHVDHNNSTLYVYRGYLWDLKGNGDKAITDYSEAIRLDPLNANAHRGRAYAFAEKGDVDKAIADYSETIRLFPNALSYRLRAELFSRRQRYDQAIADMDAAIAMERKSPCYYEARAAILLLKGDYDKGLSDLRTAIQLNPKDQATSFEPWAKTSPSEAALRRGRKQVEQMLKDRPAMACYGAQAEFLYQWAARKFAGEDLNQEILWDSSEPRGEGGAEHESPTSEAGGRIRVSGAESSRGKDHSFEEMWSRAVFELYNITGVDTFKRLTDLVTAGKLSKEEFLSNVIECESRAAEKSRAFYIHRFLPWAQQHRVPTEPYRWFIALQFDRAENILSRVTPGNGSYQRYYRSSYDIIALRSLLTRRDRDKAIETATHLLKHAKTLNEKVTLLRCRGVAYYEKEEFDRATADFSEAIRLEPKESEAYQSRASVFVRKGDLDKAIDDYSEAIRLSRSDVTSRFQRGSVYMQKGQPEKAIVDFSEAIELKPNDPSMHAARGYALAVNGELDRAIADFSEAIRLDPTRAVDYYRRAGVFAKRKDIDSAITDLLEAIRLYSRDATSKRELSEVTVQCASALLYRAAVRYRKQEYDKAIDDCSKVITLDPENAAARLWRGVAWHAKGQHDKAIADYSGAIRLDPTNATLYGNRGAVWAAKADYDKAIADLTEAIRLDPKHAGYCSYRAAAWEAKGAHAKAIADLTESLRLDPKSIPTTNNLAWLLATCPDDNIRDGKKAIELATKSCELTNWDDPICLDTLAAACAESGDFKKAVECAEKGHRLFPPDQAKQREALLERYKSGKPYRRLPSEVSATAVQPRDSATPKPTTKK
ncbi:MAG: tetratricopeptide repeat protein [Planctomycetaceae bacterium]|nr:tetratricopeptide repeat protein [Planctomycetaceae bacterium]